VWHFPFLLFLRECDGNPLEQPACHLVGNWICAENQ